MEKEKRDIYEWSCFLLKGTLFFMVVAGFFMPLVQYDFTIAIDIPIVLLSSFVMLYLYRRFLILYVGEKNIVPNIGRNFKGILIG